MKFHFGASSWGGTRKLPRAFTEQGVVMLSSVLRSPRAVQVNIEILRAFVRLREMIATNRDLARRLDALEKRYNTQFKVEEARPHYGQSRMPLRKRRGRSITV